MNNSSVKRVSFGGREKPKTPLVFPMRGPIIRLTQRYRKISQEKE
jgi:hypothetical protein